MRSAPNLGTAEEPLSYDRQTRDLYQRAIREAGDLANEGQRSWSIVTARSGAQLSLNGIGKDAKRAWRECIADLGISR